MKNRIQTGLILSMVFLCTNTIGQTTRAGSEKFENTNKTTKTFLDFMINVESTNLHYGNSNSALADFKKPVKGLQAGLSFQAGITPGLSLVTELYFMKKGGKLITNNPLSAYESTLRLNTLELPVLARFHFGKIYMNAGPSIAYNIGGTYQTKNASKAISFNKSIESFKRMDAGIQMGGGFEFPLKQKRVALDLRYNYGLTNISYGQKMYNRSFIVSVHFSKPWKTNPLGKHKIS